MKANDRGSPEVLRGQPRTYPLPSCTAWCQLARPIQQGPQAGLCLPSTPVLAWSPKEAGKTPGMEPPARPWHGSVQEWPRVRDAKVPQGWAPFPSSRLVPSHTRVLSGFHVTGTLPE